jgi:Ala-tRNA(Pro) deacylase
LQRTLEYLDQRLVRYAHSRHPAAYTARQVAAAEHLPLHKLAKTIIVLSDQAYAMAVVPADALVDLEELRRLMGVESLRLAGECELAALFPDAELGSMPPFGNLFGLPVYMDSSLLNENFIGFNAGTHRDLIFMPVSDFVRLAGPVTGEFAIFAETVAGLL